MTTNKIRCKYEELWASGQRRSWVKTVTAVDTDVTTGYAFSGEFLRGDTEVDLPIGQIVVGRYPTGSVKNGSNLWFIAKVFKDGLRFLREADAGRLNDDKSWSAKHGDARGWDREYFLSFRDLVAKLVAGESDPESRLIELQARREILLTEINEIDAEIVEFKNT